MVFRPALLRPCVFLLFLQALPVFASDVFEVRHVSDGDTLVLEDGRQVRLIGVDTPEFSDEARNRRNARLAGIGQQTVNAFAGKAKDFTESLTEGRRVRLEYDWQRVDKYGRTLAYVYREEDGLFVNAEIIRQGYGFFYGYFPFRHSETFQALGEEAREHHRGLWRNGSGS